MEDNPITLQPEYQLFRKFYAEKKAPLVLILGSGLSSPARLPTWLGLRKYLQEEATNKIDSLTQIAAGLQKGKFTIAKDHSDPWVAFKLLK